MHLSLVLSGFISLDCGISKDSDYIDQKISINYISDESFIETGVRKKVPPECVTETSEQQLLNLRSFSEGTKNCYDMTHPFLYVGSEANHAN